MIGQAVTVARLIIAAHVNTFMVGCVGAAPFVYPES